MSKKPNQCYVYIYLDPRRPGKYIYDNFIFEYEPFYVGKGTGYRYRYHLWNMRSNKLCLNKIKKIKTELAIEPIILKLKQNLNKEEAFELEKNLIFLIGRIDLKTGPLCNFTIGGEGAVDNNGRKWTAEQREKLMKIRKIKPPRLGMKTSEKTKRKQSAAKKGKPLSKEHKEALRGRKFTNEHKEKLRNKKLLPVKCFNMSNILINEYVNTEQMAINLNINMRKAYYLINNSSPYNGLIYKR